VAVSQRQKKRRTAAPKPALAGEFDEEMQGLEQSIRELEQSAHQVHESARALRREAQQPVKRKKKA
jgi:hypothetical protein